MNEPSDAPRDSMDERPEVQSLFANLREALPSLEKLLKQCNDRWVYDDLVYRFYHHSFKVYGWQETTSEIVQALQALAPGVPLNERFSKIVKAGTGKAFRPEHNQRWDEETRPMLEAFFHARFFLEMAVRYGTELTYPPVSLPSGWATFLYLYNLR
jgi:hypothetical protein